MKRKKKETDTKLSFSMCPRFRCRFWSIGCSLFMCVCLFICFVRPQNLWPTTFWSFRYIHIQIHDILIELHDISSCTHHRSIVIRRRWFHTIAMRFASMWINYSWISCIYVFAAVATFRNDSTLANLDHTYTTRLTAPIDHWVIRKTKTNHERTFKFHINIQRQNGYIWMTEVRIKKKDLNAVQDGEQFCWWSLS